MRTRSIASERSLSSPSPAQPPSPRPTVPSHPATKAGHSESRDREHDRAPAGRPNQDQGNGQAGRARRQSHPPGALRRWQEMEDPRLHDPVEPQQVQVRGQGAPREPARVPHLSLRARPRCRTQPQDQGHGLRLARPDHSVAGQRLRFPQPGDRHDERCRLPAPLRSFSSYSTPWPPPYPPSTIDYDLNRACKAFRGWSARRPSPGDGTAQFSLLADGATRYSGGFGSFRARAPRSSSTWRACSA